MYTVHRKPRDTLQSRKWHRHRVGFCWQKIGVSVFMCFGRDLCSTRQIPNMLVAGMVRKNWPCTCLMLLMLRLLGALSKLTISLEPTDLSGWPSKSLRFQLSELPSSTHEDQRSGVVPRFVTHSLSACQKLLDLRSKAQKDDSSVCLPRVFEAMSVRKIHKSPCAWRGRKTWPWWKLCWRYKWSASLLFEIEPCFCAAFTSDLLSMLSVTCGCMQMLIITFFASLATKCTVLLKTSRQTAGKPPNGHDPPKLDKFWCEKPLNCHEIPTWRWTPCENGEFGHEKRNVWPWNPRAWKRRFHIREYLGTGSGGPWPTKTT